jgi:hypothetical protein
MSSRRAGPLLQVTRIESAKYGPRLPANRNDRRVHHDPDSPNLAKAATWRKPLILWTNPQRLGAAPSPLSG